MKFNLLSALAVSSLFGDVTGTNIRSKRALQETTVGTVVDVATGEGVFGTLLAAATAAGLVETLSDPDATLTVFAPVDTAFEGVDVTALLADTEGLKTLLLNHVLLDKVLSTDLSDGQVVTMAGGSDVTVMIGDGKVMINNAEVVDADVMASNGVIHAVDSVISFEPEGPGTVVDVATGEGVFGTLLTAATAAGLVETLNNPDATLTVFAPVDTAFEGVDVDALLADTEALKTLLLNHVLLSEVLSTDLSDGQVVTMAGGSDVTVMIGDGKVMINNAEVVDVDVMASNGVIHAVDSVITFEEKEEPDSSVKAFSLAPIVFTAMISMIVV